MSNKKLAKLKDENGLSLRSAEILRESIVSAKNNPKSFKDVESLFNDVLSSRF